MTAQDRDKFATYYRDSTTGLDYAQNRYYANTLGRFLSPDPYKSGSGSGRPAKPQSWNRYSYVSNDPINYYDPSGLFQCNPDNPLCNPVPVAVVQVISPAALETELQEKAWEFRNVMHIGELQTATKELAQPCQDALKQKLGGNILTDIASGASEVNFYDARLAVDGKMLVSDIVPNVPATNTRTLFQASQGVNAFVPSDPITGIILNIIVLAPTFFALPKSIQQATLVHEALHAVDGIDDVTLAKDFGLFQQGMTSGQASTAFQKWLNSDCANP